MMFRLIRNLKQNDAVVYNGIDATVWEIDLEKCQVGLKLKSKTAPDNKTPTQPGEFFTRFNYFDTDYIQFRNQH